MSNAILSCTDLSVNFGGIHALSGVTFKVTQGETLGIAGPNGAGKTTLFNAISGHVALASGEILFDEKNIFGLSPDRIFRIGLTRTFQLPELVETQSFEANIALGAHFAQDRTFTDAWRYGSNVGDAVQDALDQFGLTSKRNYKTKFASLFERKLLMIASAYAARPKIILMDEPAGGLVDEEIDVIMEHIRGITKLGVTVLLVEHVMRVLMELSDRVIVLNQGQILFEGSPEQVRLNHDVRRLYFGEVPTV